MTHILLRQWHLTLKIVQARFITGRHSPLEIVGTLERQQEGATIEVAAGSQPSTYNRREAIERATIQIGWGAKEYRGGALLSRFPEQR